MNYPRNFLKLLKNSKTMMNSGRITKAAKEEGRIEQAIEAAINLLKLNKLSPEEIANTQGLPLEKVLELQKNIPVNA